MNAVTRAVQNARSLSHSKRTRGHLSAPTPSPSHSTHSTPPRSFPHAVRNENSRYSTPPAPAVRNHPPPKPTPQDKPPAPYPHSLPPQSAASRNTATSATPSTRENAATIPPHNPKTQTLPHPRTRAS